MICLSCICLLCSRPWQLFGLVHPSVECVKSCLRSTVFCDEAHELYHGGDARKISDLKKMRFGLRHEK